MSNWDRRELMQVADAIRNVLKDDALADGQRSYLVALLERAEVGSKTVQTNSTLLQEIKGKLCAFCREQQLCHCEGAVAWSHVCEFSADDQDGNVPASHSHPARTQLAV
jgi:hypothetical protein